MADARNVINVPVPGSARFQQDVAMAIGRIKSALGPDGSPTFASTAFTSLTVGGSLVSAALIGQWNTAYGWGDHAGLYDLVGTAAGAIGDHETTYDHTLLHSPVTIPEFPNGLSLTGQEISLPVTATPQFTRLGVGVAADATVPMFISGAVFPVMTSERVVATTGVISSGFRLLTRTTGDMADAFGGGFVFSTQDDTSGVQNIARVVAYRDGDDASGALGFDVDGVHAADAIAMTLRANGNLGIGTASPSSKLSVYDNAAAVWSSVIGDGYQSVFAMQSYANANNPPTFGFYKAFGSMAAPATPSENYTLGQLSAYGYSTTAADWIKAADIRMLVDGEPDTAGDTSDMPGRISFWTTPNGSSTIAERMRISGNGNVTVDTSTFFVDAVNHAVGIGTAAPEAARAMTVSGDGGKGVIVLKRFQTSTAPPTFMSYKARGTGDSPVAVATNDRTGGLECYAWDGNSWVFGAYIGGLVDGVVADDSVPMAIQFLAPTERMRISSNGNVAVDTSTLFVDAVNHRIGVGTLAPGEELDVVGSLFVHNNAEAPDMTFEGDGYTSTFYARTYVTGASGTGMAFQKARGSKASPLNANNNDRIINIGGQGYSTLNADFVSAVAIRAFIDGTPDLGGVVAAMPGRLSFWTTPVGSTTVTERMRISNNGYVNIGTTATANEMLEVAGKIRANTAFNLNGTDGLSQTTGNPGSITSSGGIITAMSANPYGSMYANNVTTTIDITASDTMTEITTGMTGGTESGMTFQNSHEIKCLTAGKYMFVYSISMMTASVANKEAEGAVMVNGTASTVGTSHSEVSPGGSNRPETVSGTGILALAVNDVVSLAVSNHTDTTDLVVHHASLTLVKVGN